jgi:hypothetical protein
MSGEIDVPDVEYETNPFETWLRTEVVAAYDELRDDPSRAISSDEIRAHLAEVHKRQDIERSS